MRVVLVFTYFLFTSLCNRIRHQFRVQNAKFSRSATHEQINEIMSRERIENNGRLTLATPADRRLGCLSSFLSSFLSLALSE